MKLFPNFTRHHLITHTNSTVEPQCNEPLYNKDLGIANNFLYPSNSKIYEKVGNHDIMKPCFSEQILPVP